ncbi:hypothetical protein BOTCAL_0429g00060 [Botryotinia calthae]|uniref:Uncharacterized protein n=1 Tax=Botryotinia calthae TaxID=38488 RepID=A0A4Y8CNX4_9HELO|nr:hypothetical protein BOTCAL_0429g00060 [Botryotinia calthae]
MDALVVPVSADPVPLSKEMKLLIGQRDALREALRKFHVTSPRTNEFGVTRKWYEEMYDEESLALSEQFDFSVREWSRYEAKDFSQLDDLQGRDRESFFKEVAKIVLLEGPDKQELPKGLRNPHSLILILGSLMTHHIFTTVYLDPFFFLGEETSQILNDIMSLGNTWNLGVSQRWRADTLKLLYPLGNTPDERIIGSGTEKLLRKAAVSEAANFMRSPVKYIMNGHPDALRRLGVVYMQAAEHSFKIWTREAVIKLFDDPPSFLGQPFDVHNRYMKPHDRVNQDSDINPTGQKISLVASPAIARYGLRRADPEYHEERWWHEKFVYRPAKVWFYLPKPGSLVINEQDFKPIPIPPRPANEYVTANPHRSDLSPETLHERMIKRFDRATELDLVTPYLDDFAEQLRPVIEGLRGEVAQRIEERNEMEKQRDEFRNKYVEALRS